MKLFFQQLAFVLVRFAAVLAICAAVATALAFSAFVVFDSAFPPSPANPLDLPEYPSFLFYE